MTGDQFTTIFKPGAVEREYTRNVMRLQVAHPRASYFAVRRVSDSLIDGFHPLETGKRASYAFAEEMRLCYQEYWGEGSDFDLVFDDDLEWPTLGLAHPNGLKLALGFNAKARLLYTDKREWKKWLTETGKQQSKWFKVKFWH